MERLELFQNENAPKGNSEDSLLVIYILQILKKYSSPKNPLSSQDVMDHLRKDYSFGDFDEADPKRKEKAAAQQKKVRRLLDTLYESYWGGCIKKEVGKTTREGNKWFYDISRDRFADKEIVIQETLTETEVEFLVDLISATKILNCEGTRGLIDKLLKKTSITKEDRERRLGKIEREAWLKTPNEDLVEKKDLIEECFDNCCLTFDYEDEESITAIPLDWCYDNGTCFLYAKVGDAYRKFSLDKIRICDSDVDGFEELEDFRRYNEETDSDKTTLDSLFVNIPTIKNAISNRKCIHFLYRSYAVSNDRVISTDEEKSVLPHSLVFNDGKYYLIGIDENSPDLNKIAYFRVDLMFELCYAEPKIALSNWDKYIFDSIERARLVEKHPLMLTGKETTVTFKVAESGLNRVVDAFAVKPDKFDVTKETLTVNDSSENGFHDERIIRVNVTTSEEEAFRWALANADVVELVYPPNLRHKLRRIATPIHKTYVKTTEDKVQLNIDRVFATEIFKIDPRINEEIAIKTFNFLNNDGNNSAVKEIKMYDVNADLTSYVGEFTSAKRLDITKSQCTDPKWIAKLKDLVNIHISMTSISDVSWMSEFQRLKIVRLIKSPISDLSVLNEHQNILMLELRDLDIRNIGFIENLPRILNLRLSGCPIEDYSPLLRMNSLDYLEIDEKAVASIGMDNLIKHHPDAVIEIQQKINNRKV